MKRHLKPVPTISVIMPVYNHERYVKEAIDSVLGQSVPDFELIIINDGSTDGSEAVVKSVHDDRIKYLSQENQGAFRTINKGIRLSRGAYISILNSDDVYHVERFQECLRVLKADETVHAVFSRIENIDAEGKCIRFITGPEDDWAHFRPEVSFKDEGRLILDLLSGNFLMTTSNLFCRRTVFDSIGFFSNLRYAHDYDFFLRLCCHHKVHTLDKPLLKYRTHDTNAIRENEAEVCYEAGFILADFFLKCDLKKLFDRSEPSLDTMLKFYNSVNTHHSDRMIMTLLTFGMNYRESWSSFSKSVLEKEGNQFRRVCIEGFQQVIEEYRESQKAWRQWAETDRKLAETDRKLAETDRKLAGREEELTVLRNSYSFRIGRVLTWPLRKARSKK